MEPLNPATDGASANIVGQNLAKLRELFPDAFTESSEDGEPRWKVDFDALREVLGDAIDDKPERYSFTWNGKSRAKLIANTPTTATLRPCPEESVNWESTKNLFIEGDNLEVLKLLQKSYHRKVKMIYIDPPYNTGGDFIYPDNYKEQLSTYLRYTGQSDSDGLKLSANTESSGRYHTNWLNMMLPRLKLARNLLRDDGFIFISIDDCEIASLRKLCDELFGDENFVANIVWSRKRGKDNSAQFFSRNHEHLLVYARSIKDASMQRLRMPDETRKAYKNQDGDSRGDYRLLGVWARGSQGGSEYAFEASSGESFSKRKWLVGKERMSQLDTEQKLVFNGDKVYRKLFLTEYRGDIPETIWLDASNAANAADEIKAIFGAQVFDTVKPLPYIEKMIKCGTLDDSIVLDFFAGSSTTAHAVMNVNREDGGHRRFIMVQLPEPCDEESVAFASGYENIADIGKDRIRRAIRALVDEQPLVDESADGCHNGFKCFKLDSSSVQPWDADFDTVEDSLLDSIDNIKHERTESDVLYELLLKYGLDLAEPIEEREIAGSQVFSVGAGALVVCLDKSIDLDVVEGIVALKEEQKPEVMRVVFRDSGFKDDVVKANAVQILKQAGLADEQIRSL